MDNKIKEILNYAVYAPSGDNSQPWRFEIKNNILKVFNIPEKDNPFLNYMQSGSYIAHGALLKNIEIVSPYFGLEPVFDFSENIENLVVNISFKEVSAFENKLFDFVKKRLTNRRMYNNESLKPEHKSFFKKSGEFGEIKVYFTEDEKHKNILGRAGSSAEIVILENDLLHTYLFKDVMWSKKQENKEKRGLFIDTMEFNPVQKFLFKLASNKTLMKFAVKIGFPYFIAKEDAKLYASGAFLGIITTKIINKESFLKIGMKMQEIWLEANSLGLAFQPITATCFFNFKLKNNLDDQVLSTKHKEIIKSSYLDIVNTFKIPENETPFIMFRIGYAKSPSAKSSRKEPEIVVFN